MTVSTSEVTRSGLDSVDADVLIVGQGVAGSVLALTLEQRGLSVQLVSAPDVPAASAVAAGIVNPLTGRKLVKTWEANRLFPYLHQFYTAANQQLSDFTGNGSATELSGTSIPGTFVPGTSFFTPLDIYRPYRDDAERKLYQTIAADPELQPYFQPVVDEVAYGAVVKNPFGGIQVTQAGWVDLPLFLSTVRRYFTDKGQFTADYVQVSDLELRSDSVRYANQTYRRVIFCDGPHGTTNPLFDWLPYNVVKGELLTAEVDNYPISSIINQGIFVMPVSPGRIRIGATYAWHELDWQTTEGSRSFLEMNARALLKIPFRVVDQQAGIRPSTKDRRPFIGWHPTYPTVGIFGGMGTKGVSLAPYLAHEFADHFLLGKEINPAVNISRFRSL